MPIVKEIELFINDNLRPEIFLKFNTFSYILPSIKTIISSMITTIPQYNSAILKLFNTFDINTTIGLVNVFTVIIVIISFLLLIPISIEISNSMNIVNISEIIKLFIIVFIP